VPVSSSSQSDVFASVQKISLCNLYSDAFSPLFRYPYHPIFVVDVPSVMARETNVYLFGDQTNSFDTGLRRLLLIKENVILTSFFERVHYALRLEIGKLGIFERELFPRFTSLGDLLARYRESENNAALESALTAIHQLGSFIW